MQSVFCGLITIYIAGNQILEQRCEVIKCGYQNMAVSLMLFAKLSVLTLLRFRKQLRLE